MACNRAGIGTPLLTNLGGSASDATLGRASVETAAVDDHGNVESEFQYRVREREAIERRHVEVGYYDPGTELLDQSAAFAPLAVEAAIP
jgi:hypothetical protein